MNVLSVADCVRMAAEAGKPRSERTIRKAIQRGALRAEQINPRMWIVRPADFHRYIEREPPGPGQRGRPPTDPN